MKKTKPFPSAQSALAPDVVERASWLRGRLLAWFERQGRAFPWREPGRSAYQVVVAEILLQRTTAASVARAYTPFLDRYPCWSALAEATPEELQQVLRPLGLWQQKANVLLGLSRSIGQSGGQLPASRAALERFKGIGQYTASAVLAVAHGQSEPLVDVNTARVLGRFFGARAFTDVGGDSHLHALARRVTSGERSLSVSWAVLDFGALVCRARRPLCTLCPLAERCASFDGTIPPA